MRVDLKPDEGRTLMASMFAITNAQLEAQRFIEQQNAFIQRHKAKQEEVVKKIRKRIKGCPKTPLWAQGSPQPLWDLSGIDPVSFEGSVEIPEEETKQGKK